PPHAASWSDARESRRRRRPDAAIADLVLRQLENRGAPAAARTAAARLRDADTVAVVTGQQAGLFGGPLFTLHKAITAVRLARWLADEHDTAAVPVFWVDAEDHDLEEIRGCHVLDGELQRVSVSLDIDAPPDTSAAAVVLDDSIRGVLDSLRAALPPTEFTAEVLDALAASYAPGMRLVDGFARWLDRLLGDHGLVVFDASDPAAKPFVRSLFKREIGNPGRTAQLAADAGAELTALGYHAQVSPAAGAVALFRLDGARRAIRAIDGTFSSGGRTLPAQALQEDIDTEPARFSPNVLLRPVVQDTLLPTVAYVAGPSELAYLGQLRGIYAAFDVPMPIIYPRASATLVDAATVRFLNRYEVDFAQLQPRDDAALNRLLAQQIPEAIEQAIAAAEQSAAGHLDTIRNAVPTLDPTLAGAASSTAGRIARELGNLRGKVVSAAKRKDSTLRRQFERARAQSFPGGAPQERSVAGVHFLNRHGFMLVDRLLDHLPLDPGHHWLLTV
ncbi:MAG: bacillithiol biosynthesis cysteine-adding enzyme BshC, partial [Acidobacteria bacterium]|nr:bacillithiol biosynthesis cysteine-adding enzyme BshC [Acidobacteriota bacterium]